MSPKKIARFAQGISLLFSPLIWVCAGVFRLLRSAVETGEITFPQAELLLAVILGGPVLFFLLRVYQKHYDFDLSVRKQRLGFYLFSLGFGFLGLNFLYALSARLFGYFLSLMIVGLVFMMVTFWDKISLHVGSLMTFYLAYNLTHQWRMFFLFPVILLVGWSRVYLKHHTFPQILEGILVPLLILPAVFYLFGVGS